MLFDLFSTLVQPAGFLYLAFLIYSIIRDSQLLPLVSMIMLGCAYGLQVLIFLMKREWAMIGWMIIYMFAMPIFGFFIPLYAFYNMDCFEWGNTRLVAADSKKGSDSNPLFTLERRRGSKNASGQNDESIAVQEKAIETASTSSFYSNLNKFDEDLPEQQVSVRKNSRSDDLMDSILPNPDQSADINDHSAIKELDSAVTAEELENEVRCILATYELKTLTRSKIIEYLEISFERPLVSQTDQINRIVDYFLNRD